MIWQHETGGLRRRAGGAFRNLLFLVAGTALVGVILSGVNRDKSSPASAANTAAVDAARRIVADLSSLNLTNAPLTADQAAWFKEKLAGLSALGSNALPAIADFLGRNVDLYFDAVGSAELAGVPSLRVALFEVAGKLRGPDAVALLKTTVQATADPVELATLAKLLDRAEPGKHHATFLAAARETLALAASASWDGRDVAPLFEMLKEFGGATVASDVERYAAHWFQYAAITLLELPEVARVPELLKLAQNTDGRFALGRAAFLRALAQTAIKQTSAADELLAQTRANQIGEAAWPGIGAALSGHTLHFARPVLTAQSSLAARTSTRTIRLALGNQRFLEIAPPDDFSPREIGDRIRLIDRLLEATTNPSALDALEGARIQLSARLSRTK